MQTFAKLPTTSPKTSATHAKTGGSSRPGATPS